MEPESKSENSSAARRDSPDGCSGKINSGYYDHFVGRNRNGLGVFVKRHIARHIVNLAALPPHCAVFELGPGDGDIAEMVTHSGCSYLGMDASPSIANNLRLRGFSILQGFAPPLPSEVGKVDAIFALHVIEHMKDIASVCEFLSASHNRLTENGRIILATPDYRRWGRHFYDCDYTHCLPFTPNKLRQTVESSGYNIIYEGLQSGLLFGYLGVPIAWIAKLFYTATVQDVFRRWIPKDIVNRTFLTLLPNILIIAEKRSDLNQHIIIGV